MLNRKTALSSLDVAALVRELRQKLTEKHLDNVYEIGESLLLLRFRPDKLDLLIEKEKRTNLTKFILEVPQTPPPFCQTLRKQLIDAVVSDVNQHEYERILEIAFQKQNDKLRLILEIFRRGRIILVDSSERILAADKYLVMKDRKIIRGEQFQYPPPTGLSPLALKQSEFGRLLASKEESIFEALKKNLAIDALTILEAAARSNIDPQSPATQLDSASRNTFYSAFQELLNEVKTKDFQPRIIYGENGEALDVTPLSLTIYRDHKFDQFSSFNEAVDEYFKLTAGIFSRPIITRATKKKEELERIIQQQESQRIALREAIRLNKLRGELIFKKSAALQSLLEQIKANSKKTTTGVIEDNIVYTARKGDKKVNVIVDGIEIQLDVTNKVLEAASDYFERAKKAKEKLAGLETSLKEARARLGRAEKTVLELAEKGSKSLASKREKSWYEKFHWFRTSDDFLVLGGRDAANNELLIKKYVSKEDLIIHAEIQGAPFVVIKSDGRRPSEKTITEAAKLGACYSKAWQKSIGSVDVYYVSPDQVSKSAPSGQFVAKGAFMIYGKKNYVKNVPLELSIGVEILDNQIRVISGPKESIAKTTPYRIDLVPGDVKSSALAKQVRYFLAQTSPDKLKHTVKNISLDEILRVLPPGGSRIVSGT